MLPKRFVGGARIRQLHEEAIFAVPSVKENFTNPPSFVFTNQWSKSPKVIGFVNLQPLIDLYDLRVLLTCVPG